jgi:hypothetical protein
MPEERRRSERTHTRIPITLRMGPADDAVERMGTTVDLSQHGARIVTNAELRAGQTLEILSFRSYVVPVRAQVVWVRGSTSGPPVEAGLEFLD